MPKKRMTKNGMAVEAERAAKRNAKKQIVDAIQTEAAKDPIEKMSVTPKSMPRDTYGIVGTGENLERSRMTFPVGGVQPNRINF